MSHMIARPMAELPPRLSPSMMVWTFARAHHRLEIRREQTDEGPLLVVVGGDAPGSTLFSNVAALIAYQTRLESTLINGGWSLFSFEPERRSHEDRRAAQRETFDRRRWWTDPEFRKREAE
jgi:hypothetical protein